MSRYAPLPEFIRRALAKIEPSGDNQLLYYPCRVTLISGETLDTVYIEPEKPYLRLWGVYPENDRGKKWIRIEDVSKVEDSSSRLPARFANDIYSEGESGMGYTVFTVVFADGSRQAYISGNAIDFIYYPAGKGPTDVTAVLPHEGRKNDPIVTPDWYWCLYSEQEK